MKKLGGDLYKFVRWVRDSTSVKNQLDRRELIESEKNKKSRSPEEFERMENCWDTEKWLYILQ